MDQLYWVHSGTEQTGMEAKMNIIETFVTSDLYVAGRTEDGEDYTAEVYLVVVGFADGTRWAHKHTFPGCKVEEYDDGEQWGTCFNDIRASAKMEADHLCFRVEQAVKAGKALDDSCWYDYYPEYGSSAYMREVAEMTPAQRAGEMDTEFD